MTRSITAVAVATAHSPLPAAELIQLLINAPLPDQFHDWLILKGVVSVEGQDGAWDAVGKQRTLHMSDDSRITEELAIYDPQRGWTNNLFGFTNMVKGLLTLLVDSWSFTEDATGTTVTWTWTFYSQSTLKGQLGTRYLIAPLHRTYLQRILDANIDKIQAADRQRDFVNNI